MPASTFPSDVVTAGPSTSARPTVVPGGPGGPRTPPQLAIVGVELNFEDPSPGGQGVWLANRGTEPVDISCWRVRSGATGRVAGVPQAHTLRPGAAVRFSTPAGVLRATDSVTLLDRTGRQRHDTPRLRDDAADDRFWYLRDDGVWEFGRHRFGGQVSSASMSEQPC